MIIDLWIESGVDPTLVWVIDALIMGHAFAFVAYFVLLARDLIRGTESAYVPDTKKT